MPVQRTPSSERHGWAEAGDAREGGVAMVQRGEGGVATPQGGVTNTALNQLYGHCLSLSAILRVRVSTGGFAGRCPGAEVS